MSRPGRSEWDEGVSERRDGEGRLRYHGQPGLFACSSHIGRHKDVRKRVQRSRTPYSVTQLDNLSDLVTTCPLPPLKSRADFHTRRHPVARRCRCHYILDGKSSPPIRGARGFDGGRKPHEDVAAPVVWCKQTELPGGTRPFHCALYHDTASFYRCSEEGVEPAQDDDRWVVQLQQGVTPKGGRVHVTTMRAVCDPQSGRTFRDALKLSGPRSGCARSPACSHRIWNRSRRPPPTRAARPVFR